MTFDLDLWPWQKIAHVTWKQLVVFWCYYTRILLGSWVRWKWAYLTLNIEPERYFIYIHGLSPKNWRQRARSVLRGLVALETTANVSLWRWSFGACHYSVLLHLSRSRKRRMLSAYCCRNSKSYCVMARVNTSATEYRLCVHAACAAHLWIGLIDVSTEHGRSCAMAGHYERAFTGDCCMRRPTSAAIVVRCNIFVSLDNR